MNIPLKKVFRRLAASVMLFTAEAILAALLFISLVLTFLAIAHYVLSNNKNSFDAAAFEFVQTYVSNSTTKVMLFFTTLGNYQFLVLANVLLTLYFLVIKRHKWYSIKIASIALSSVTVMSLMKLWFNRSRPLMPLLEPARGLSFPSGHAMSSVTFFGLIIYYVYKNVKSRVLKIILIAILVLLILVIGVSRVYLRVHYASDVLAGFFAGAIWLMISIWILKKIELYSKRELNDVVEKVEV
ncbi:phosphatase PAP2 family protein [Desertivirga arenae]|uniref:phosphatase PAP2 family protein n=1 Tax=Desertivirga arenae TaxID=2810309 RepID=UPI001A96111A|nr:phosphatase PAP2 family protein [Pedobacter sp. SYSU D00823]